MTSDFHFYSKEDLSLLISCRKGEEKLGECICIATNSIKNALNDFAGRYVVLGVAEDIGPRANLGKGGANEAFAAFLKYWLNTQHNRFIDPKQVLLLGSLNVSRDAESTDELRQAVVQIDEDVEKIVSLIFQYKKIPIVIGGGHNNAYPIIKAYHSVFHQKLKVINLDPHADYRALEGRHSGNSFSYAQKNGFIEQYGVIGLHRFYNSESMLQSMDENNVFYTFYDSYLENRNAFLFDSIQFAEKSSKNLGIELDLDGISNMPSSAMSPMGWRLEDACLWLQKLKSYQPVYYHFPEGAPKSSPDGELTVGKSISYFVNEIIRL